MSPADESRNRSPEPPLRSTPVTSRSALCARAKSPYARADVAGAAGSPGRFERRIIQWEKTKHAAMNTSKTTGNPMALPSVFGT